MVTMEGFAKMSNSMTHWAGTGVIVLWFGNTFDIVKGINS